VAPRAKPTEQGARELGVLSGPAPELDPEETFAPHEEHVDEAESLPLGPSPLELLAEWETETVGLILSAVLLSFHWTLGRGGPPDAYVPEDAELAAMARPATRILNRSERARRFATHGDAAAFAAAFGGFVVKETKSVAEYRAAAPAEQVEVDLAGVGGVRAAGTEAETGPVRRWRPPALDEEPPPA
jgi:hypothetical protein